MGVFIFISIWTIIAAVNMAIFAYWWTGMYDYEVSDFAFSLFMSLFGGPVFTLAMTIIIIASSIGRVLPHKIIFQRRK